MSEQVWRHLNLCPNGDPGASIADAALAVRDGTIAWLGAARDLPREFEAWPSTDLGGAWVTPSFVDCHTHLVFGGHRADEFALRLAGASYEEIARHGGGIVSTVRATRAADEDALLASAAARLEPLIAEGVGAIEIKSPEFAGRADAYIDEVCERMLPALADEGLVDAVDVFCERIGFTLAQSERVFEAAQRRGLPVKIHAEQLSLMGGTALAARYRALSADHLEFLNEAGVRAMKEAGTVAVLLPSAYYFIRETQLPPIELLRRHGVPIALATDCNPGTSPATSLLAMLNLGCTLFRLTVPEVLQGVTRHAASALGRSDRHGELAPGRPADFVVWSVGTLAELAYWIGRPLAARVVRAGKTVHAAPASPWTGRVLDLDQRAETVERNAQ
jgi:imidazolonepropionase